MIMTAQLLLSLSILIVLHEGGHFVAARMFNIRVEKFYLFFDFLFPMANIANFSLLKFKKGDTEYGIGWFPLGGYVKIAGMVDESMDKEQLLQPAQPWEFRSKKPWQRLIVMLGGIIVNVITGILIYIGITFFLGETYIPIDYVNSHGGVRAMPLGQQIGFQTGDQIIAINGKPFTTFEEIYKPETLLNGEAYFTALRDGKEVKISVPADFIDRFNRKSSAASFLTPRTPAVVESVAPNSIASKIGLQKGDRLVAVNGHPMHYLDELDAEKAKGNDSLALTVKRGEQVLNFKEYFKGQEVIGFSTTAFRIPAQELIVKKFTLWESFGKGPKRAWDVIALQFTAFKKIFKGEISLRKSLTGPIGMAQAYGGSWDWVRFWNMTGLLSIVLAFMNLLPIPALDGGYVVFLLYEMITGREPTEKVFETAVKIGMALLLALMVFVFYNDIARFFE